MVVMSKLPDVKNSGRPGKSRSSVPHNRPERQSDGAPVAPCPDGRKCNLCREEDKSDDPVDVAIKEAHPGSLAVPVFANTLQTRMIACSLGLPLSLLPLS